MNTLAKYSLGALFAAVLLVGAFSACKKDDSSASSGTPVVKYIRSTDPAKSDSLLVGSFMGSLIAIVGENLGNTREIWFNDQQATLNPPYITDRSILVNVPATVPVSVNDKMRLVFADGSELLYDFKVNVPAPTLNSIKCEYVPEGGTVVLNGDFFFEPTTIKFSGDVPAEIVSLEKTRLEVRVPAGAQPGPITVQTNFGKIKSKFYFRDDRNVLLDYDTKLHETWTSPIAGSDPVGCSNNYTVFKSNADGAWQWANELTMQYWAPRGRGNVPVATGVVNDLALKFEVNVPIEWRDVRMEIFFGPYAEDHGRDQPGTVFARWKPWAAGPFTTDGWETVTIPLKDFKYTRDDADDSVGSTSISNLSAITNLTMMLFGPANSVNPVKICIDNPRVVPQ
jgi:hypothetical protein